MNLLKKILITFRYIVASFLITCLVAFTTIFVIFNYSIYMALLIYLAVLVSIFGTKTILYIKNKYK